MKQRTLALLTTGILSALLFSAPSFAGDYSAGKEAQRRSVARHGLGQRVQGRQGQTGARHRGGPQRLARRPARRRGDREGLYDHRPFQRWPRREAGAERRGHRRRSRMPRPAASAPRVEGGGGDPADAASRDIVGPDNRVQVTKTHDLSLYRRSAISRWRPRRARCGAAPPR